MRVFQENIRAALKWFNLLLGEELNVLNDYKKPQPNHKTTVKRQEVVNFAL